MGARFCGVEEGEGAGDVWGLQLELFVLKEWLVSGCEEGIARRHVAEGKSAENLKSYTGAVKGIVSVVEHNEWTSRRWNATADIYMSKK